MSFLSWSASRPRRGILPKQGPSALDQILTRRTMVQVWLGLIYAGLAVWLVVGSTNAVPVFWTEGSIAPRTVYAPRAVAYQMDSKLVAIQPQELIVAKGQRLTSEHVAALRAIGAQSEPLRAVDAWSLAFLTLGVVCSGFCALRFAAPKTAARTSELVLTGLMSLLTLGFSFGLAHSLALPLWMTPTAALGMVLTLLLNPTVAIVATVSTGLLIGLMAGQRLLVALAVVFGATAGAVLVRGARRRATLMKAGIWSGVAQGLAVVALKLVEHDMPQPALLEGLWAALISGSGSFVLTMALLPVLENLFGVVTNVTLLELSDLNHPLLKELSIRAPGTYHHSLIV
ncbi:MAG: hypothetical protein HY594_00350, partial [Candidatus Omnitrophica bacterium]|nr:hypothetical protein [Candidatus Omnitrophota bacterium]